MTFTPKKILVTAALPYANGFLHLGHLAGAYMPADIYVRYQRLRRRDVLFLCGSDEHGVAISVSAEKEKTTPRDIIDRYHPDNEESFRRMGISFDNYSRTSLPLHYDTAREFFSAFHRNGVLKEKKEQQLYCETDAMFLADRYVEGTCPHCSSPQARGDQCENCGAWLNQTDLIDPKCKICGRTPVIRETTHWYFPLGKYQKRLEAYIKERHERDGWKENVLRYCESWFKQGLEDRAVTRDLSWGVPVPVAGYEQKVIYVWFDAVLGYISSGKEWALRRGTPEAWTAYWQDEDTKYVAFIGKDNVVFHCIVFPAMLMAWNDGGGPTMVLPENVPANEFLNFEGQKFSKSRGWGIDVREFLRFFPPDYLRYALAVTLPETRDSDFYLKDFQARINNELADIFGNFINRTLAFTDKNFGGKVPPRGPLEQEDKELLDLARNTPGHVADAYEHYRFRDGVAGAMNLARAANKYFNDREPWKTVKANPARCATTLNVALQVARTLAVVFEPVVPGLAERAWRMLGLEEPLAGQSWEASGTVPLPEGHRLGKVEILIPKVEDARIAEMHAFLQGDGGTGGTSPPAGEGMIGIDVFQKVDLRVARVVTAEKVKKSEKLLKLTVDLGGEKRQILAGIALHYAPEDLVDKLVVVVANLKPAKLMGMESQGMLLAASDGGGSLSVVTVLKDIQPGSTVK